MSFPSVCCLALSDALSQDDVTLVHTPSSSEWVVKQSDLTRASPVFASGLRADGGFSESLSRRWEISDFERDEIDHFLLLVQFPSPL